MKQYLAGLIGLAFFLVSSLFTKVVAQDLEPRILTPLPTGTNFAVGAYGYTKGDITHKTPKVTSINFEHHSFLLAYLKSFSFFGMSAKIGAILPFVSGNYNAYVGGDYQEFSYAGLSDPKIKFSFNFMGSPASDLTKFKESKPDLIAGFSLLLSMPLGEYQKEFFINPGRNSWIIRPQLGMAKYMGKWIFEGYMSTWLITKNTSWLGDDIKSFQPLYTFKIHVIRKLNKGAWFSLNTGYGIGNETSINYGDFRRDFISTIRVGLIYVKPISKKQSLKIGIQSDIRFAYRYDFTTIVVAYQFRWFDKLK